MNDDVSTDNILKPGFYDVESMDDVLKPGFYDEESLKLEPLGEEWAKLDLLEFNRLIDEAEDDIPANAMAYGMDRQMLLAEDGLPVTGYLRLKDVLTVFPVSKSTWYDGIKKGKFPEPIKKFGAMIAVWRVEDIRTLLKN